MLQENERFKSEVLVMIATLSKEIERINKNDKHNRKVPEFKTKRGVKLNQLKVI